MGSGAMGSISSGGLPPWVHIPKPSKCSGPSSFNSTCNPNAPSTSNNSSSTPSSSSSNSGFSSKSIAALAKIYEAEQNTSNKD